VMVAGCSSSGAAGQPKTTRHLAATDATTELSARLVLPSRTIKAGSNIPVRVVVENHAGHPIATQGCGPKLVFTIELSNDGYQQQMGFAGVGCRRRSRIPTGRTTYSTEILASYTGCRGPYTNPPVGPPCQADGTAPPLPVGTYRATLHTIDPSYAPGYPPVHLPPPVNLVIAG
jgi:hypothetical protein